MRYQADLRRLAGNAFAGNCVLAVLHVFFSFCKFKKQTEGADFQDMLDHILTL